MSVVVAGVNVHDTKLLEQILEQVVVAHPTRTGEKAQNLCLDKGYNNPHKP